MALKTLSGSLRTLITRNYNIGGSLAVVHSQMSTTAGKPPPSAMYELRVYGCPPGKLSKVLKMFEERIHLRTKHSVMFGFWTSEIGDSACQMVHLWGYDSLSQRLRERATSLEDKAFATFRQELVSHLDSMVNALLVPAPGTAVNVDFVNDPAAVYELQTVEKVDGKAAPLKPADKQTLVGRFYGVLGPTETEYRLWRYPDIDSLFAASSKRALESPEPGKSVLLYPTSYSPVQ